MAADIAFVAVFFVSWYYLGLIVAIGIYVALNAMAVYDARRRRESESATVRRGSRPPARAPRKQAVSETPAPPGSSPSAELERLAALHERGVLSDEEFQQAKQRVLDS
jgi:hypothetical protein